MTNTIPNVPRELLEDCLIAARGPINGNLAERLSALLSAPSPAGVDGLEVVATLLIDDPTDQECGDWDIEVESKVAERMSAHGGGQHELCRLSDAHAIIDGLRGEIEVMTQHANNYSRMFEECAEERDQHAQRIGELEAALEFACKSLAQVTSSDGSGHADIAVSVLRMAGRKEIDASQIVEAYKAGAKWRIDAALSAGKEGE